MKNCKTCGKEYEKGGYKFCSDECRPWRQHKPRAIISRVDQICPTCGLTFFPEHQKIGRRQIYCSWKCRSNLGMRICVVCGAEYKVKHKRQITCSHLCGARRAGIERAKRNRVNVDGETLRRCPTCKEMKPLNTEHYHKSNSTLDGFAYACKACQRIRHIEYNKTDRARKLKRIRRQKDKVNPNGYLNGNKYKENRRRHEKERSRNDVMFAIKGRMRSRMFQALKRGKGGRSWQALVGYSVHDLKAHIEKQFTKGMTWRRFLDGEIHIDHKIPVVAFNFTTGNDIDFKRCWAINNLQPLWAKDNRIKSDKILYPFQPSLALAVSM